MRREPVHAPVQQMACQHVRGHAGVGEDAERRVLGHGHIQRAQVVPAVQGEADDLVPGQGQAGAGLLQGADRRNQTHGLRAQLTHQGGPDAEKERVAVGQQQHAFPGGAHLAQAAEQGFQRQGERQKASLESALAVLSFKGRQQFPAAAEHIGRFQKGALFRGEGRRAARAAAAQAQYGDGRGLRRGGFKNKERMEHVRHGRPAVRLSCFFYRFSLRGRALGTIFRVHRVHGGRPWAGAFP